MKTRDFGFLLAGLMIGAAVCAAFLISHRGHPESNPQPVASNVSTPAAPSLVEETPAPAYRPGGNIYLAGEVHKQGVVEIRPNETLTVSQAIALDGGVAAMADARNVRLMRRRADGSSDIIPVDLQISDSGYAKDPAVQPGDLINVPEKEINR